MIKGINEYLKSKEYKNLNILHNKHMNVLIYMNIDRNINDFWYIINNSIKCIDIIIFSETASGLFRKNMWFFLTIKAFITLIKIMGF